MPRLKNPESRKRCPVCGQWEKPVVVDPKKLEARMARADKKQKALEAQLAEVMQKKAILEEQKAQLESTASEKEEPDDEGGRVRMSGVSQSASREASQPS